MAPVMAEMASDTELRAENERLKQENATFLASFRSLSSDRQGKRHTTRTKLQAEHEASHYRPFACLLIVAAELLR